MDKLYSRTASRLLAVLALTSAPLAYAGGPLLICDPATQTPFTWQVPPGGPPAAFYNIEIGPLNSGIDNATATDEVNDAFAAWEAIPTAAITYPQGSELVDLGTASPDPGFDCADDGSPIDVDGNNFFCVVDVEDGQSPVIFDADGSIADLLGLPAGVLGFATPEFGFFAPTCAIVEGLVVIIGTQVQPDGPASLVNLQEILVHEIGHFSNLAHTVTNGEAVLFGDATGPSPFNTFGPAPLGSTETMYPILGGDAEGTVATPHADDIAALSTLYPAAGFPGAFGTISGTILATDSVTGLTGVNVIARNVNDPFDDAVSAISGDFTQGFGPLGINDGSYTLNGLTPGADYVVYIDEIIAGGFSTPLRTGGFFASPAIGPFPGPEEFYNGALESSDPDTDAPEDAVLVPVASETAGIDIITNTFDPPLQGDFNGDNCVDRDDLRLLLSAIRVDSTNLAFDVNNDGVVDREDSRVHVTLFTNRRGDPCF